MFNSNPFYSALYLYINSLESGNISFGKVFNINNVLQTSGNVILREIKYQGDLRFYFNNATNEVRVFKVPYVMQGEVKVPVFTSDIAQIVLEQTERCLTGPKITVTFSDPYTPLAIDNNACTVIPSLVNSGNYKALSRVLSSIIREEERIRMQVKSYKNRQDRRIRAQERALAKKRSAFGLDINDYDDINEFYRDLSQQIEKILNKKISDGHYTFEELYRHRIILFCTLCNLLPDISWKSKKHFDEENDPMFDDSFIAGINTPKGIATYHIKLKYWDIFNIPEIERAPKYDNYSSEETITRIQSLNK